jgi:hypothetical protein
MLTSATPAPKQEKAKPEAASKGKDKPAVSEAAHPANPAATKAALPAKVTAAGKAAPKAVAKAGAKKTVPATSGAGAKKAGAAAQKNAAAPKDVVALSKVAPKAEDEVYKDVRSRHKEALKAAEERSDRIAGNADSSDEAGTKKRFPALHLFDAFQQNRLPKYGGFIVCIRFSEGGYTVIEIIGYGNMQDLYPDGDTLVFKSVGCKLYALVEPSGYLFKSVEPVNRPSDQMIPYRFAELLRITTKRFQGILVGRKPVFMPTSFSVFKPAGEDLSILFYDIADVYSNIQDFLIMIFRDRLGVPVADSRKAAEVIARGTREFRLWLDEA